MHFLFLAAQPDNGSVADRYFWFRLPIVQLRFGTNGLTIGNSLGQFSSMQEIVQVSLDWASAVFVEPIKQKSYILRNRGLELGTYSLRPKKTSHSRIQNLSQKTSHLTKFRKCMCMQESISTKYRLIGANMVILPSY